MRPSKIRLFQAAILTAAAFTTGGDLFAGPTLIIPVSQDESVVSGFEDKNYSDNINRGGLFVGSDGTTGIARFYLQFVLPDQLRASSIDRVMLSATYEDDLDRSDNGVHRIHFVAADDWTEGSINWSNQPGPTYGSAEALFDSASARLGGVEKWDITALAQEEAAGDGKLSLMFAASNESTERDNRNWEYFSEREFNPAHAFKLTISTSGGTGGGAVAVPLPAAVLPAAITCCGALLTPRARRMLMRFREK